jgi:hypothetical protein
VSPRELRLSGQLVPGILFKAAFLYATGFDAPPFVG